MGLYQILDGLSWSHVESTRNAYQKAVTDVEGHIAALNRILDTLKDKRDGMINCFLGHGDASAGEFVYTYEEKIEVERTELIQMHADMYDGREKLKTTLSILKSRLAKLDRYWIEEDKNEKTMTWDEIRRWK